MVEGVRGFRDGVFRGGMRDEGMRGYRGEEMDESRELAGRWIRIITRRELDR